MYSSFFDRRLFPIPINNADYYLIFYTMKVFIMKKTQKNKTLLNS